MILELFFSREAVSGRPQAGQLVADIFAQMAAGPGVIDVETLRTDWYSRHKVPDATDPDKVVAGAMAALKPHNLAVLEGYTDNERMQYTIGAAPEPATPA